MSRNFVRIDQVKLMECLKEKDFYYDDGRLDIHDLIDSLDKDIKVNFDLENFDYTSYQKDDLLGLHTLENGLTFWGMYGCGDWESPVFFIVYWDGTLRGYVPKEGNCWNTTTKTAYGNDAEEDYKNAKKRWPNDFVDIEPSDVDGSYFELDWDLLKQDILNRFEEKV